jgi:hypothetical protein
MTKLNASVMLAGLAAFLIQAPIDAAAQGKGGGKGQGGGQAEGKGRGGGQGKEQSQGKGSGKAKSQGSGKGVGGGAARDKGRGNEDRGSSARGSDSNPGRGGGNSVAAGGASKSKGSARRFERVNTISTMPQSVRRYAASGRAHDMILAAAASHAFARGRGDDLRFVQSGNGLRLTNRNGEPLVYLDDRDARDMGRWRVDVLDDDVREGSPSFCRSGEGHPVWGRQWCLDKGFGLGSYRDYSWGRTHDVGDIFFQPSSIAGSLVGGALESVLGRTAYNRLALHAVTLGLVDPLAGRWISQDTGPRILLVNSAGYPVAEVVDVNRDNRAVDLLVALRSW